MSAFVDALRRLDAEASPAPFRHGADYALYDAKGDAVVQYGDEVGPYLGGVNDDLFILLRNAAPEIAALVEAGLHLMAYAEKVRYCPTCRKDSFDLSHHSATCEFNEVRAALSRLDGTVKP